MATSMQRERPLAPMAPMAPPPPPKAHPQGTNSLMSPPEPILDSFNQSNHGINANTNATANGQTLSTHNPLPMSPPISPCSKPIQPSANAPATPPNQVVKDPVLYPTDETSPASPSQQPLFALTEIDQPNIDNHIRTRSASTFNGVAPPERRDYELVNYMMIHFRPQVMEHYKRDPRGWLRRQRAQVIADNKISALHQKHRRILPATKAASPAKPARKATDRVSKPKVTTRPARNSVSSTSSGGAVARPAKRTSATPEPSRRNAPSNREDKDFNSIPDYCPSTSTLPPRANCLKVDWKGPFIDLNGDPFAHLCHREEILLAGILRLDCATYLTSKRRIFERRVQCLRANKEFRKTDAQQACKIDVNKASKLWTAFEKVGWLAPSLFQNRV
ncbi:SWIRM domain protein [Cordyceps militaris CM01]|uniref:SWIRM domain protein n=1 Tax=Cordyceps militaris (strain CM01) TaxID=983644 RepID=G3JS11_CORMM|nr:SWIRM domain protein [Cordyceps militaris CM01]EGX88657.1 SWIRM domain protein [Cordyceps militaris CM01]